MPFNIEPLHIGLVAVVIIAALAWYFTRKNKREDSAAVKTVEQMRKGLRDAEVQTPAEKDELTDVTQADEPDVPVLKPEDGLSQDKNADDAPENAQPKEDNAAPEPELQIPEKKTEKAEPNHRESGRSAASVDKAVEAVVLLTPAGQEAFDKNALIKAAQAVAQAQNSELMTVDFFDAESGRWFHDASMVTRCTQMYLSMLLANRTRKVDQLTASIFITLAGQISIDLNAEATLPDSQTLTDRAEQVAGIVKAFDNRLTLKIVCAGDIDREKLAQAAGDSGFAAFEGRFEKTVAESSEPVMTIEPSKTLPNELELTLDVALASAANDPLAQYFAIANDLCCKIDGMVTDMEGNPLQPGVTALIARQFKEMHAKMSAHGVAAGSKRAMRIFSRA